MTNHSHPSAVPAANKPPSKTPRTERELIELALDQAHSPRIEGFSFPGDLPAPGTFPGYELIREVHRGGQGAVYLAVQLATKRRVAIKLMHGGPFRGSSGKARFEREVQILGQLNHPNIVRIHDSGNTADGSNFYVMDYVSGRSLDELIATTEKRPPVEETLRQFHKICEGINAAHLKGIIHRDIKPSNIRISNSGEPIVVDFGLAKVALPGGSSDETPAIMSMTGQFIGSLPWASPEQAEGVHDNVDVRTDVYSLGIVLYQLLTGKFPYDVIGNMRDVLDRILRAEPARPSTVRRQINDEVETIVLKCLTKDRERRYQSAGDLARDIERYLNGQPIEAKRDSIFYVITKTARRYWVPAATLTGMMVAIAVFGIVMSVLYRQKSIAEQGLTLSLSETNRLKNETVEHLGEITKLREAELLEREKSAAATTAALSVARQMLFELDPAIKNLVGSTAARINLLKMGNRYLQSLQAKVGDDPAVMLETAEAHERIGEMQSDIYEKRLDGTDEGLEHLAEARKIREQLVAKAPDDLKAKRALASSLSAEAGALRLNQKFDDAIARANQAIVLCDQILVIPSLSAEDRLAVEEQRIECITKIASSLGMRSSQTKDAAESERFLGMSQEQYTAVVNYWKNRLIANPKDPKARALLLVNQNAISEYMITGPATAFRKLKQFDRSIEYLEAAEANSRAVLGPFIELSKGMPQDRELLRNIFTTRQFIGWAVFDKAQALSGKAGKTENDGPLPQCKPMLAEAMDQFGQMFVVAQALAIDIANRSAKRDLAVAYNKVANAQRELGKLDSPDLLTKSYDSYARSLELRRDLVRTDPISRYRKDLIVALVKMGDVEQDLSKRETDRAIKVERLQRAMALYAEVSDPAAALINDRIYQPDHPNLEEAHKRAEACKKALADLGEKVEGK